jgi:hypothetical protein
MNADGCMRAAWASVALSILDGYAFPIESTARVTRASSKRGVHWVMGSFKTAKDTRIWLNSEVLMLEVSVVS